MFCHQSITCLDMCMYSFQFYSGKFFKNVVLLRVRSRQWLSYTFLFECVYVLKQLLITFPLLPLQVWLRAKSPSFIILFVTDHASTFYPICLWHYQACQTFSIKLCRVSFEEETYGRQTRSYYYRFIVCALHYILLRDMGRGQEGKEIRCWKYKHNMTGVARYVFCLTFWRRSFTFN